MGVGTTPTQNKSVGAMGVGTTPSVGAMGVGTTPNYTQLPPTINDPINNKT